MLTAMAMGMEPVLNNRFVPAQVCLMDMLQIAMIAMIQTLMLNQGKQVIGMWIAVMGVLIITVIVIRNTNGQILRAIAMLCLITNVQAGV